MPIYAYRCSSCGFEKDVLQKMSDPLLTVCPQCQAESFVKQLTAAGFQLKGSGWYATDFKSPPAKPTEATAATETKTATAATPGTATSNPAPAPAPTSTPPAV